MTIQNLTNETFAQEIQRSTPILVDFWAPWCGYCRRIGPALEKVAQQSQYYSVAKLNIDDFPEIAEKEGVEVIPTLILYRDGKALGRIVAPDSKAKIDDFIRDTLGGTV